MNTHSIAKKENRQIRQGIFEVWKERGETLAALLVRFRKEETVAPEIPVTYAGRLDPMAEGIVILLAGEARFQKEEYMHKDKVYECTLLCGVATDTYDILGIPTAVAEKIISIEEVERACDTLLTTALPYPPYASRTVEGKPLFSYARAGETPSKVPMQAHCPKSIEVLGSEKTTLADLGSIMKKDRKKVEGDFRQEEIEAAWDDLLQKHGGQRVQLFHLRIVAQSGVYVRSIAHEIGKQCNVPALAYTISRTAILY